MKTKLRYWLPAAGWAALIFVLSSMTFDGPTGPAFLEKFEPDKLVHLALYGVLAMLMCHGLRRGHALPLPAVVVLAIVLTSAYGVTDEWHQHFVPGRDCNVWDWVADTAGAALAAWIYLRWQARSGVAVSPS